MLIPFLSVIYLSGNYIGMFCTVIQFFLALNQCFVDQLPHDDPPSEDELQIPEDDEAVRLEDVSSDVEVEADEFELPSDHDVV